MSKLGLIEVVAVSELFPGLRRVHFSGEPLRSFPKECAGAHLKLFFPPNIEDVPDLSFGRSRRQFGAAKDPIVRTYSVRSFDAVTGQLTVEFVVHAAPGAASDWARAARPGLRIGIAGPMMLDVLSLTPQWNLFVGDLSALPMISALVERLPATAVAEVLLELPTTHSVQLHAECQLKITQRHGERGQALPALVSQVAWPQPEQSRRVCVAAESAPTVSIRRYLQHELNFPKHCMYTVPYWKHSVAEEEYHDERHAEMDAMEE